MICTRHAVPCAYEVRGGRERLRGQFARIPFTSVFSPSYVRILCEGGISAMLCKIQWLLLVPKSHVFGCLVGNDIQRMRRVHSVCLFEDAYVCVVVDVAGDGRIFPGKRRRKGFLGSGARVCMVMPMLRRAQACQRVAGVVRIGMPVLPVSHNFPTKVNRKLCLLSGFIPKSSLSLTTT